MRGFSAVSMLIIDEAARVDEAMYKALRDVAVGGGDLWMMSTPFGKRGFFYECWEHGGEMWERVQVAGAECERISRGFLEEERGALGATWFAQEYQCSFVDNGAGCSGAIWSLAPEALDRQLLRGSSVSVPAVEDAIVSSVRRVKLGRQVFRPIGIAFGPSVRHAAPTPTRVVKGPRETADFKSSSGPPLWGQRASAFAQ